MCNAGALNMSDANVMCMKTEDWRDVVMSINGIGNLKSLTEKALDIRYVEVA